MAKVVTLRLTEEEYERISAAAKIEHQIKNRTSQCQRNEGQIC
jgi:uncharacterized protein (DUF1778 family)